jgi:hypothetical protein
MHKKLFGNYFTQVDMSYFYKTFSEFPHAENEIVQIPMLIKKI